MRPPILFTLHYNTVVRREMMIVLRYRQSGYLNKKRKRRQYGSQFINDVMNRYHGYDNCMLRQYIRMLNADNELILSHIDISEILILITK